MQNFFNEIQDKLGELGDSVRSALPYSVQDKLSYGVPIAVAGISAAAIALCISANANANSVDSQARLYQEGQAQLAAVLGQGEDIQLSVDAEEIMGRADLFLQYPELSRLEGDSVFTSMEKMANVSEDAEEDAAKAVENAFYDSIIEFAGAYGGLLVRNPSGMSDDVKLAAYESEAEMEPSELSGVSNVLVKQLRREIKPEVYGKKPIKNTLTILSGNDITNFSSIKEGSVMYLLLGESTGSKRTERYVCTGFEPGTVEDGTLGEEEETAEEAGEESAESMSRTEEESAEGTDTDRAEMATESGLSAMAERHIAIINAANGDDPVSTASDGTVTYSDGTKVERDGTVIYSDGTIVEPDGTVIYPDGMTISPDGEISGASIPSEDSSEESGNTGEEETSNEEEEDFSQAGSDTAEGNSGYEEPETLADAELPTVLSGGGINIEDDKEHSVILYSVNSRTGAVTITYWDVEAEEGQDTETESNGTEEEAGIESEAE